MNEIDVEGRLGKLFTDLDNRVRTLRTPIPSAIIESLEEIEKELSARMVVYCGECECVVFPFIAEVCESEEDEE